MGVSALTAGALTCLNQAIPDAEISLLDYGAEARTYTIDVGGKRIEVRLINLRFSKRFYLPNNVASLTLLSLIIRLLSFRGLRRALVARNQWLRQIDETGLFAAISGGDSFSDIYGFSRLLYVALAQILVLILR
jgi:colanic acid/amylovoran biosynthesis protein